ncbi:MAG: MFS transporter [Candidatus Bathyarchaeota archaeon]|jgi:MFS family permease|nr:MFS transporter [Candidatus Bathyarchaeota archaeon]
MTSKSYFRITKDVFSNRNILTIALTTSAFTLMEQGWRPFWNLYLKTELNASIPALGLLAMIQSSERLLFQLPGGLLADRFGRRKIIVYGTALRIIPPLIFILAADWRHIIPGLLINGAASIYMPAYNAIIADSLPKMQRGAGFGAFRMIISIPRIVSPIIGGVVMDALGYRKGVRVFLFLTVIVSIIVTVVRSRVITETLVDDKPKITKEEKRGMRAPLAEKFNLPRSMWIMVVVAVMGSFGVRMVREFLPIYAVEVVGITNTQLGLVQTTVGLITAAMALPGGMFADRYGRKPLILASRIITPLTMGAITLTYNFPTYYLARSLSSVGDALGGGANNFAGGPAWDALVTDLVEKSKRGTVMGTIGTVTGIFGAPSSIVGAWLWQTYSPNLPFQLSMVFGLIGAGIFALGVKEPKRKKTLD